MKSVDERMLEYCQERVTEVTFGLHKKWWFKVFCFVFSPTALGKLDALFEEIEGRSLTGGNQNHRNQNRS